MEGGKEHIWLTIKCSVGRRWRQEQANLWTRDATKKTWTKTTTNALIDVAKHIRHRLTRWVKSLSWIAVSPTTTTTTTATSAAGRRQQRDGANSVANDPIIHWPTQRASQTVERLPARTAGLVDNWTTLTDCGLWKMMEKLPVSRPGRLWQRSGK